MENTAPTPQPCMESLLELTDFPEIPCPWPWFKDGTGGTLLSHVAEALGRHFLPLENHKSLNILFP